MARVRETIREQRHALERLVGKIPGFRGYHEREARREADKLLREHGANRLERVVRELHEIAANAALDELEDLHELLNDVEKLRAELRFADRGYSGFFDEVKLDASPSLDAVYEKDERIVEQIEQVAAQVADVEFQAASVRAVVKRLGLSLADRRTAILGLGSR
jgi:DNA-directed RNA polymerase specialized sigma subunit